MIAIPDLRISEGPLSDLAIEYLTLLLQGKRIDASKLVTREVEGGVNVRDIYLDVFQPVQYEVGRLWQTNEISVATEHYCTAATQYVMSLLFPYVMSSEKKGLTMVASCASGELHELGIRMVCDFFEMEGWDTYYLGASLPEEDVVGASIDQQADLLAVSVTMMQNLHKAQKIIAMMRDEQPDTKILVGGFPFINNPGLAGRIGADGHAHDAQEALGVAMSMLEKGREVDSEH